MAYNIVLIIVDCLRYDKAQELSSMKDLWQSHNHWATSHCTDPCVTHILTGKHPDELRLYSMMFNRKEYSIPETDSLFQLAKRQGYETAFITNLQRWYRTMFKPDMFVDSRGMHPDKPWEYARMYAQTMPEPFFLVLHTDDMHTPYFRGSYDAALRYTDKQLGKLFACVNQENTVFIVTSDHGEGLGQAGPDGKPIEQHGYGLWDFLTHIPLFIHDPRGIGNLDGLTDHGWTNVYIHAAMAVYPPLELSSQNVFQAGATPKYFHRGVVDERGRQFVRCTKKGGENDRYWIGDFSGPEDRAHMELLLKEHCAQFDIKYGEVSEETAVIERLEGLGYWNPV